MVSMLGKLSMLPLFLGRTFWLNSNLLGVVIVKRMPGVLGVFGGVGEGGPKGMERGELALKIGSCGGLDHLDLDLAGTWTCFI